MRRAFRRFTIAACAAAALVPAATGVAAPTKAATLHVTLGSPSEFRITAPKTAAAGKVTIVVVNRGKITHEVNIIRMATKGALLPKGKSAGQVREKGKLGAVEGLKAGASGQMTVTLQPGWYQLFCNIPGHYAAGMRTALHVL